MTMRDKEEIFVALSYLSGIIVILGTLLNGLVCITFLKYRCLLTRTQGQGNIFVFSIAVSDFLCCAVAAPMSFISNINRHWMFKQPGCIAYAFLVSWCGLVSITHLSVLAYSRYETIAFTRKKLISKTNIVYVVIALWLYAFVFAIAPVAGWSRYSLEGIGSSCSVEWTTSGVNSVSYIISLFLCCFVLPIAVILFSYCNFYKALKRMTRASSITWGSRSVLSKQTAETERKMAAVFIIMVVAFLIAWCPYSVVALISVCGKVWSGPIAATLPAYFAKLSSLYNPVIYFLLYKRFRRKVFHLLRVLRLYFGSAKETPISSLEVATVFYRRESGKITENRESNIRETIALGNH